LEFEDLHGRIDTESNFGLASSLDVAMRHKLEFEELHGRIETELVQER
jgi:hypothetical protein